MKSEVTGYGDPIVIVPGGLTGWASWKPHAERLAAMRRVILVQLLSVDFGLGCETLPSGYSVKTESQALRRTLDGLGIDRADFSGWSYGGEVLLDFTLDSPDRVRTLTLIEPPAFWVLRSRGPLGADALEFQRVSRSFGPEEVGEEQLVQFAHWAGFVPPGIDPRNLPPWPIWSQHRQSLRIGDIPFRHDDDIRRVRGFQKPALLFKGEGSPGYLRRIIDVLAEEFPNARVRELPGAHALPIISIDQFLETLTEFVEEHQR